MDKIWKFSDERPEQTILRQVHDVADRLYVDTSGLIKGVVTETTDKNSGKVIYSIYLSVPELNNYQYRLLEIEQPNLVQEFPASIKLFGYAAGNVIVKDGLVKEEFRSVLFDLISNPVTTGILSLIKHHVELKREYRKD
jgi:hypothetical protein